MAEICSGLVSEKDASSTCDRGSRAARRRRMEIRRFKFVPSSPEMEEGLKRQKQEVCTPSFSRDCGNAVENSVSDEEKQLAVVESGRAEAKEISITSQPSNVSFATGRSSPSDPVLPEVCNKYPKFGFVSVCGRRRDMEDAVAIYPSFCRRDREITTELHYFGVYDGHGCSHVAMNCRERLHELVREGLESNNASPTQWKSVMKGSFIRMDEDVIACNESIFGATKCRCELQSPDCDAVGSTAVVAIVTPKKIIVANCGDSRAVLCRNGKPVPLSSDHKPDRPDELSRIEAAGGRVIYWNGARVLGVLAMSRAIGDNYLKPYVSCEPEVTITDRTAEDECLILASDGLWDVVSNETACGVASMCLRGKGQAPVCSQRGSEMGRLENSDAACSDASMLLTKLALARHSTDNVSVVVVDLRRGT